MKDILNKLSMISENVVGQAPIPVVGKAGDTQQAGVGMLNITDTSPAAQSLAKAFNDLAAQKKVQIVQSDQNTPIGGNVPAPTPSTQTIKPMSEEDEDVGGGDDSNFVAHPARYGREKVKQAFSKMKKVVKEGAEQHIEAARLEGKAHGLKGQAYAGSLYDGEEASAYHDGYKEGLDSAFGSGMTGSMIGGPSVIGGDPMGASLGDPMGGMDDFSAPSYDDFGDEYSDEGLDDFASPEPMASSISSPFIDDEPEHDEFFEAWDRELSSLLNESVETVKEGISVSISKGNGADTVNVNASDAEAEQLLDLVRNAGLGIFSQQSSAVPVAAPSSEVNTPSIDVVDDNTSMLSLMRAVSDDVPASSNTGYTLSAGEEDSEESCTTCGTSACECEEVVAEESDDEDESYHDDFGKSSDDEDESYYDDNPSKKNYEEEDEQLDEDFSDESGIGSNDNFIWYNEEALSPRQAEAIDDFGVDHEILDWATSHAPLIGFPKDSPHASEFQELLQSLGVSESSVDEDDFQMADHEEQLDEWANDAYDNEDESFKTDIEFMTKTISGGPNKMKTTGQSTGPVLSVQKERLGESKVYGDMKHLMGLFNK